MKKQIMILFLCVLFLFTMIGCAKSESVNEKIADEMESSVEPTEENSESESESEMATEEIKVLLSENTIQRGATVNTITYEYDERGNCIKKTDSSGSCIEYLYDENDLCIKETNKSDWYTETVEYEYNEDGTNFRENYD